MLIYNMPQLQKWFKNNYDWIKTSIPLNDNRKTIGKYGDKWTSSYRRIPIEKLGFRPIVIQG